MSDVIATIEPTEQGLALAGDLVYKTVPDLVQLGETALTNHSSSEVIINCSEVKRLDSAGVSLLLEWTRFCTENNKSITLVGFPQQARSLIETFKLGELFKLA